MANVNIYSTLSAIRGYHIDKTHWSPVVGDALETVCDSLNAFDVNAVVVTCNDIMHFFEIKPWA